MSHDSGDGLAEGKLDLVPMIDCVMLLLLFFILTTKFASEEKAIANLLPTNKGQMASTPSKPVEPPQMVNICVYPAWEPGKPMQAGFAPSGYAEQLGQIQPGYNKAIPFATMRVADQWEVVAAKDISDIKGEVTKKTVALIHDMIFRKLETFEKPGARKDQNPVTINCFSGLSWRFALVAYDAVRAYEATKGVKYTGKPEELLEMREVNFAPPRIRNYTANELGNELYEIVQMK